MRTITKAAALAAATVFMTATAASAYTLNGDGTGYVGKGEVQTLLGVNNKVMQTLHEQVDFEYVATAEVSYECEWWTGPTHNRTYHRAPQTETTDIEAVVSGDSRKTGQWTGWNLSGIPSAATIDADSAAIDCGGDGAGKTLVPGSVELGETTGGLYAVHNDTRYLLTLAVPVS